MSSDSVVLCCLVLDISRWFQILFSITQDDRTSFHGHNFPRYRIYRFIMWVYLGLVVDRKYPVLPGMYKGILQNTEVKYQHLYCNWLYKMGHLPFLSRLITPLILLQPQLPIYIRPFLGAPCHSISNDRLGPH